MQKLRPYLILFFILLIFWVLLSGYFKPIQLFFGFISVIFATFIAVYVNKNKVENPYKINVKLLKYLKYNAWLVLEVFKSALNVSKAIIFNNIEPTLIYMPHNLKTEQGISILANSITLTPGTISIEANGSIILIHSLSAVDSLASFNSTMNEKVEVLEHNVNTVNKKGSKK